MSAGARASDPEQAAADFARLLAATLQSVASAERPAFLARLERLAAERYRAWADGSPPHAAELLACAHREEEIAARALRLFPLDAEPAARLDALLPGAREAYQGALARLTLGDQLRLQAGAERQGASAWRAFAEAPGLPKATKDSLAACAALEEENARCLEKLLANRAP